MSAYATIEQYRIETGDVNSDAERVCIVLEQQSAKLRAYARISEDYALNDDQLTLARLLVIDAARKSLIPPSFDGMELSGVTQGSFTANGIQQSYTLQNPSGAAYFDTNTLNAFMRSLKKSQTIGNIMPVYGG